MGESNERAKSLHLVRQTTVQLKKMLQKHAAAVKNGECASSVRGSVLALSLSSTDLAWVQVRRELQDIGISPQQFQQNRDMIIKTLQDAFGLEPEEVPIGPETENMHIERETKATRLTRLSRLVSSVTGKSNHLLRATLRGRLDDVKTALQKGANVNAQGPDGSTALAFAAERGNLDIVNLLLTYHADMNKANDSGFTPLHIAVENAEDDVAHHLLSRGAKMINGEYGSPLHLAAESGNEGMARLLLQHGAKVN